MLTVDLKVADAIRHTILAGDRCLVELKLYNKTWSEFRIIDILGGL